MCVTNFRLFSSSGLALVFPICDTHVTQFLHVPDRPCLYLYENEFLDNMIRSGYRRLARSFNLCYRYIDDLIVFNNKKFLDYLKEIYRSQLTVEKANKSDHLGDHLDHIFILDSGGMLSTGYMTNVMILTSTLSTFQSFPATYHPALHMVYTFRSS